MNNHAVGDKGQRFEIRFLTHEDETRVLGWIDDYGEDG